jgi:hypothetical protein
MILVHESVAKAQPFDESGYRGIILPVPGHGRLAVLVKDGEADLPRGGARRGARQARDRLDRVTAGLQTMMQLDNTKRGDSPPSPRPGGATGFTSFPSLLIRRRCEK